MQIADLQIANCWILQKCAIQIWIEYIWHNTLKVVSNLLTSSIFIHKEDIIYWWLNILYAIRFYRLDNFSTILLSKKCLLNWTWVWIKMEFHACTYTKSSKSYKETIFNTVLEYGAHATSPTCELRSNMNRGLLSNWKTNNEQKSFILMEQC